MSTRPHWLRGYYDNTGVPIDEFTPETYVIAHPTTERFSRTAGERRACDATEACAVERPRHQSRFWDRACWVAAFVLLGLAISAPWWVAR